MHYIIDLDYVPEELIKTISHKISNTRKGFLYIRKDRLIIFNTHRLILLPGHEFIDVEKLKELLILRYLKE